MTTYRDLQDEVATLRQELAAAAIDAERLRVLLAMHGDGVDADGTYAGTPGSRLRELLAAEAQRDAMLSVFEAAKEYHRKYSWLLQVDRDNAEAIPSLTLDPRFHLLAAVDALVVSAPLISADEALRRALDGGGE